MFCYFNQSIIVDCRDMLNVSTDTSAVNQCVSTTVNTHLLNVSTGSSAENQFVPKTLNTHLLNVSTDESAVD